jgi:putative heme-binding domain-containing protein
LIDGLIATAAGEADTDSLKKIMGNIAPSGAKSFEPWQFAAASRLLDALDRKSDHSLEAIGSLSSVLEPVFASARKVAVDSVSNDQLREPAIRLLGRDPAHQADDLALLARLLNQTLSPRCQKALFDTFRRSHSADVPSLLLDGWSKLSPAQRQSCLEVLLAREEWIPSLLNAIEAGSVGANEVSPAHRQRLLRHTDKSISQRAQQLWQDRGSRAEVLAKFKNATTLDGDASKGSAIFGNLCATCHFLRGLGHKVGPDLAALADKTPGDFLTAILDPNAVVEPRFIAYNIETSDGRSLAGVVSAETATTLTLVQAGGTEEKILRGDIEQIRASGVSLMPEGLEQNLSPQDLADLIAHLKTSPRPFGSATPEQADTATRAFVRSGLSDINQVATPFDRLPYSSWLGTLPLAYTRQTDGQAKLVWRSSPIAVTVKPNEMLKFRLPAAMGFSSETSGKFTMTINGKSALDFNVTLTDQSWQTHDGSLRLTYTVMENNNEDSNGVLTIEASPSLMGEGHPTTFEVTGSAANSQRWFGIYVLPAAKNPGAP